MEQPYPHRLAPLRAPLAPHSVRAALHASPCGLEPPSPRRARSPTRGISRSREMCQTAGRGRDSGGRRGKAGLLHAATNPNEALLPRCLSIVYRRSGGGGAQTTPDLTLWTIRGPLGRLMSPSLAQRSAWKCCASIAGTKRAQRRLISPSARPTYRCWRAPSA